MRKTRIIALILTLVTLLGTVSMLSACKKTDGIVTLRGKKAETDIAEYTLVYGESQVGNEYTTTYLAQLNYFAAALNAVTGVTYPLYPLERTKTGAEDKEILIGVTDRAETAEALKKIKGDGFAISVTDNKIAIVGTSNLFTLMALDYFTTAYLKEAQQSTAIAMHKSAIASKVELLTLTSTEKAQYTYLCSEELGKLPGAYAGSTSQYANSTYKEYAQVAVETVCEKMEDITGLGGKYYPSKTDENTYDKEILFGRVAREESEAALEGIEGDEYIVYAEGDKIIVNSWSEAGLKGATNAYLDILTEGTVSNEDGSVDVRLPKGFRLVGDANESWIMDFPKPEGEGVKLYNTMDANDNGLQFLYTGEGVNESSYKAYCDTLKAAGYTTYMENTVEGSSFTTLVNEEKGISLYVAYNAYAHQGDYDAYKSTASKVKTKDYGFYDYDPCFRIVSAPLSTSYLPPVELLTKKDYVKQTDSAVTTMPIYEKAVGLSYIVTLEDGSFVIFDGGGVTDAIQSQSRIWAAISALHQEIYGQEPTQTAPVHIAAWIITHAHWDHYYAFDSFLRDFGNSGLVKMDYLIANIPAENSLYTMRSIASNMIPTKIEGLKQKIKGGFEYIKVHTGNKFYFANLEIEVLTTWEDLNPLVSNTTNDTNTVMRFVLTNQDAPGKTITQIWTGDANRWQSRFMCATYGNYLKADMVSLAHHGNAGCEIDFYESVQPTVIWWPNNAEKVTDYLSGKTTTSWWKEVDHHVYLEMPCVKYIYASGAVNTGNEYYTTLKLTANGPDYDGIYDVVLSVKNGSRYGLSEQYTLNSPGAFIRVSR